VPPAPPGNNAVTRPTSSTFTALHKLPGVLGGPPISIPAKQFQPATEPKGTDVAGIADLPALPDISYYENDADYESDDSSVLGPCEGKATISLK
jgi:hypothetical protein